MCVMLRGWRQERKRKKNFCSLCLQYEEKKKISLSKHANLLKNLSTCTLGPVESNKPESTGKKWVKSIPLNIHRSSRDFCSVWAFTHWVKMRNRVRARGYWSKPHFSLPYPWIWVIKYSDGGIRVKVNHRYSGRRSTSQLIR